jgi:chemotaxis signal transduction protein
VKTAPIADLRYLWFEWAGGHFAAPMDHLQEVLSGPALRPLPAVEPAFAGLMVLREHVLPVFDPMAFANSQSSGSAGSPFVVVLGFEGQPALGLLAEKIGKVVSLSAPVRQAVTLRVPAAFAGETNLAGSGGVLVFDISSLATAMGLARMSAGLRSERPLSPAACALSK